MIGFAGMMIALPTISFHVPITLSILFAFAGALLIGFLNGLVVVRTGLPSFIVTLASLYILRGLTLALSILFTNRTIVGGVKEAAEGSFVGFLFSGTVGDPIFTWLADHDIIGHLPNGDPSVKGIPMPILWALAIAIIGHIVLTKTKAGNWIFASGGDANAARSVGVPVAGVKIALFMLTAFCATVFAACQVLEFGSAASDRGLLKEFEAIIAAVIGGCLLTGGYGSVVGACFGALIYGVVQQGIEFIQVPNDWFRVFLGGMLLIAVLFNNLLRRRIVSGR
jgi:simple sugar transport system permease protein